MEAGYSTVRVMIKYPHVIASVARQSRSQCMYALYSYGIAALRSQ